MEPQGDSPVGPGALNVNLWMRDKTGPSIPERTQSVPEVERLDPSPTANALKRVSAPKRGNPPRSGNGFSSRFRGVIHHRRSQRFEAHIWSEGKQTYLGGFDTEYEAAVAYDLAAVKFRGQGAIANFPVANYKAELKNLDSITRDELVQQLRNQGKGGQTKTSRYRGVMKHAKGKWEARLGQACGSKYQYLGLFSTEIDAAVAYDRAAIAESGLEADPNFSFENYTDLLENCDQAEVAKVIERQKADAAAAAAAKSQETKHDWMHHFVTHRQRQAEAAAAAARQQARSPTNNPPNTFKRFLDSDDESAFAQLGLKHFRRPDGGFVPIGSALSGSISESAAARAYSDGAAIHVPQPLSSMMSASEAAVVELFVNASKGAQGPALSAPAHLDERLGRTRSDQTHAHAVGDVLPGDAARGAHRMACTVNTAPQPSPPPAKESSGPGGASGSPTEFARAATMPASCLPGPAVLDTMESADTVHTSVPMASHTFATPALPDLTWDNWLEQFKLYAQGCNAMPDSGELGQWCSEQLNRALNLAAGSLPVPGGMTRVQYDKLTAIPVFAQHLSVLEKNVFTECIWRLSQFVEAHGRMPTRRLPTAAGTAPPELPGEKELADWSAMQRRLAVRLAAGTDCGQMSQERVLALMAIPGWLDVSC